jgi:hypothetical protein
MSRDSDRSLTRKNVDIYSLTLTDTFHLLYLSCQASQGQTLGDTSFLSKQRIINYLCCPSRPLDANAGRLQAYPNSKADIGCRLQ